MFKRPGIVFFALFIWQLSGFIGYFEYSYITLKKEIKQQIKKGVPQSELITFKLSKSEQAKMVWLDRNEFQLNGNLYDVIHKFRNDNGFLVLHCISDVKEKVLFATLGQTVSQQLNGGEHNSSVVTWFKLLQLPILKHDYSTAIYQCLEEDLDNKIFIFYKEPFSSEHIEVFSPPPIVT